MNRTNLITAWFTAIPFLIYWVGGGNFERGESLAITTLFSAALLILVKSALEASK